MKKIILTFMWFGTVFSTIAMADPTVIAIHFVCPAATGVGLRVLTRYPTRVSGYGTETLNGQPSFNSPYFNYNIVAGDNIPMTLISYSNSGTGFSFTTGMVFCSYTSSSGFTPFSVSYQMVNVAGGQIAAQTLNTITINQFIGMKI
jgi:hypothetical protein